MPDTKVLETIKSVYDATEPTVKDFMPDNSTGDINQEKLSNDDYFPGRDKGITAGTASGITTGSYTLYAPQGELVPFAAYASRDRAVEAAAQQRMKDEADYQKAIKAPETKLQSVNNHLHDAYLDMLYQEQNRLKKTYGRNWVRMVNQDIPFQRNLQNYHDAAKYYDSFINKYSKDDELIAKGEMVPTKEYLDTRDGIMSGFEYIKDPSHPQTQKLSENFLKYDLERNFMSAADLVMKDQVKRTMEKNGVDPSNPELYKIWSKKEESYTPEQLDKAAPEIKNNFYSTNPRWTIPAIRERLQSAYGNIKEEKTLGIQQKRDDGQGGTEMFDETQAAKEPTVFNVNMQGENAGAKDPVFSQVTGAYGVTYATPPKGQLPVGQQVFLMDNTEGKGGMVPSKVIGVKNAVYGKSFIGEVLNAPGTKYDGWPVTEAMRNGELTDKNGNKIPYNEKATRKESLTVGQYTEGTGDEKVVASFIIPTEHIANVLTKKKMGSGKSSIGVADYHKQMADQMNKGKMSAAAPAEKKAPSTPKKGDEMKVKGGTAVFNGVKWEMKK